jgi:hypothetical protein
MSASWASRAPGRGTAVQDRGLAVSRARRRWRLRLASCASRGECMRSKSRPVSPMATTRGSAASRTTPPNRRRWRTAGVVRMDPDRGVEPHSRRPAPRPPRRAGVPARARASARRRPLAPRRSLRQIRSNASAWRWAWLSISRIGGRGLRPAQPARGRRRGLGLEAREERLGRRQRPASLGMSAPAQLVEERRPAVAVGARTGIRSRAGPARAAPPPE